MIIEIKTSIQAFDFTTEFKFTPYPDLNNHNYFLTKKKSSNVGDVIQNSLSLTRDEGLDLLKFLEYTLKD